MPPLGLPGVIHQLALTAHYGFTMLGDWDLGGLIASVILYVGGTLLGASGFQRLDLRA